MSKYFSSSVVKKVLPFILVLSLLTLTLTILCSIRLMNLIDSIKSLQGEIVESILFIDTVGVSSENMVEFNELYSTISNYMGYTLWLSCLSIFFLVNLGIAIYRTNKANEELLFDINKKNSYLEHAAKILRHDMHSGINVYIPRGLKSLERRLSPQQIEILKIEAPLKMISEGLNHTRRVYQGVYEFTNLVKKDTVLNREDLNTYDVLKEYLGSTSYKSQVILNSNLPTISINKSLFCTAIDNLIRNGLKYNDSDNKVVKVYYENGSICIEDNGRGMTQEEFNYLSRPYTRKSDQKEQGMGLGLNICKSILDEHKFGISVEKLDKGMSEFYKELHEVEDLVNQYPDGYHFDKEVLEKEARENNYSGKIIRKRGGRKKSKIYIIYDYGNKKPYNKGTKIKIKVKG